jgi:hypothetical protein
MQEIKIYVSAAGSLGVIRDYANAKGTSAPTLMRGCEFVLRLRLFANAEGEMPYPIEQLQNVSAWQFVMDKDYDNTTPYLLVADNANIKVSSVTEEIDDLERSFTEIEIPLLDTNTEQLAEYLKAEKSKSGITAELTGFDKDGNDIFVLQIENFTFRNRLASQGQPTVIDPEYLTAAQINAIVADLQQQIDNISPGGGSTNAADIIVSSESEFYAGMDVASALQIIGAELDGLEAELESM